MSLDNYRRRFKRNLFSTCALIVGLVSSMLIISFSNGNQESIKEKSYHQFNFGVATLYKESSQNIPGSKMSLVQMSRLNSGEVDSIRELLSPFEFEPNTDSLFPPSSKIITGDETLDELTIHPVFSFESNYIDRTILIDGGIPLFDDSFQVVINTSACDYLKKKFNSNPVGLELDIHSEFENHYYTNDTSKPTITDYFIYDKNVTIVGVVDDFYFLSTPKIYYSYLPFKEYLEESLLINLSSYLNEEVSWYDYLISSNDGDAINSYSNRLFLRNIDESNQLDKYISEIPEPFKVESTPITISNTLLDLMNAATMGMELFLVIALAVLH